MFNRKTPFVNNRGIHLDLKGLPPTFKRLMEIVDLCGFLRLNFILFEMEDMFPWETHPVLRARNAYSKIQMKKFYAECRRKGIQIIPLVQSYGHMENVLIRAPFKKFREAQNNPRDVCPLKGGAREVILGMLKDVIAVFPDVKYFHLGGDEAHTLGTCPRCRKFVEARGRAALYLEQLNPLMDYLNSRQVRPILWHDMMAKWTGSELKRLKDKADLMIWIYNSHVWDEAHWNPAKKTKETADYFRKAQIPLWGAGAYRCGGDGKIFPDIVLRSENMKFWAGKHRSLRLKGLVATGWSRMNTLYVSYGTLENALEALALSAKIMWDGKYDLERDLPKVRSACRFWISPKVIEAGHEFQKWLNFTRLVFDRVDMDRGIREGGPRNEANLEGVVRRHFEVLDIYKRVEKNFLKVMKGRAFPDDVRQWLRAHLKIYCDRFDGLKKHILDYI